MREKKIDKREIFRLRKKESWKVNGERQKKIEKKHRLGKDWWKRSTKRKKGRKEIWKGTKKNGQEERGERYMERSEKRLQNTENKK